MPSKKKTARSVGDVHLPKALLTTGFDEIATAWHKNPRAPEAALPSVRAALIAEGLRVLEALLIAPKVSFRVYGENVVLCRLIDLFGTAGVEQLLEEGAIEFVLWRGMVAHLVEPLKGVQPLTFGNFNTPAHCDPEASVKMGLKWEPREPATERLVQLAIQNTRLTPESSPGDAVNATTAAYAAGSLRDDGFNPDVEMSDLDADQRAKLATIAGRAFEGLVLVQGQYDLHESAKAWEALIKVYSDFPRNRDVSHTVQTVLSLEGLPNIRTMALHHVLTPGDVVRLRSAEATDEFRRWLWSQPDPRDAEAVGRQYLKVLSPKAHVADKSWFKVARISTITAGTTAAGAAVGTALAGPTGAVVGGAISLGASLLDAFGIEKFLRGNNPRRFAEEELRPLIAQKTLERAAEGNRRSRRAAAARARGDK